MKKIVFCVTMLCISFYSQAAEAPTKLLPTRSRSLGDTGAETSPVRKHPSIERGRRDSNGTPYSPKFLQHEGLCIARKSGPGGKVIEELSPYSGKEQS